MESLKIAECTHIYLWIIWLNESNDNDNEHSM